jgi:hypothetical protein
MTRVCLNLSEGTAQRLKEVALKQTGSMKGLSIVGEEAITEYLEEHYPKGIRFVMKRSDAESQVPDVAQEGHTEICTDPIENP